MKRFAALLFIGMASAGCDGNSPATPEEAAANDAAKEAEALNQRRAEKLAALDSQQVFTSEFDMCWHLKADCRGIRLVGMHGKRVEPIKAKIQDRKVTDEKGASLGDKMSPCKICIP